MVAVRAQPIRFIGDQMRRSRNNQMGGCEVTCRGQVEGKAMQEYGQGICCAHCTFGRYVEGHKTQFGRHKMTTKLT